MKKLFFALSILLILFTFIGAGYVLCHRGEANAGYAAIPMLFALLSINIYRQKK